MAARNYPPSIGYSPQAGIPSFTTSPPGKLGVQNPARAHGSWQQPIGRDRLPAAEPVLSGSDSARSYHLP